MQLTQKHIIGIIISGLVLVGGYYAVQDNTPSQSNGVKINPISKSDTGIETDTGKRLESVANSGTQWGMSPFGSGKPLEEREQKSVFQKPNTEWKTRTLSGITYVFGEGNPVGATPLSEERKEAYKKCIYNTIVNDMDCPPVVSYEGGYMTSDIEKSLIELISHPNWSPVLISCEQQFRKYEYPEWGMSYNQVIYGGALNLENMITIDNETGRKQLKFGTFPLIRSWFSIVLRERNNDISGIEFTKLNNCITQNGGLELYRLMDTLYQKQFYPDGKYPDRLTDRNKYIPWY